MEIAVVGRENFVIGFRLAGIKKTYISTDSDIEKNIENVLRDKDVGILVVHNATLKKISHNLKRKIEESAKPVVIAIGKEETVDIQEKIKQAVGVDLWRK
jgi:V/A-type H+-transporting ATPase subunit F